MAPTDASYLCNGTVPIRSGEHFSILNTALSRNSPRRLDREEWSRAPTVGKYFFLYDAQKKTVLEVRKHLCTSAVNRLGIRVNSRAKGGTPVSIVDPVTRVSLGLDSADSEEIGACSMSPTTSLTWTHIPTTSPSKILSARSAFR